VRTRLPVAIIAAILAAACTAIDPAPAPAPAAAPDTTVAGTYEVVLCDGCDAAGTPAAERLRVVLYGEPLFVSGPLAGVNPPDGVKIFQRMLTLERENYCFGLPPGYERGLVGAFYDTAIAIWERTRGDSIRFPLYRSADAGVEVRVRIQGGRMSGVLEDWYAPGRPTQVIGAVTGRRVGPPDPEVCGLRNAARGGGRDTGA
jgi:hypothetical protein